MYRLKKIHKNEISFKLNSNTFLLINKFGRKKFCIRICWKEKKWRRYSVEDNNSRRIFFDVLIIFGGCVDVYANIISKTLIILINSSKYFQCI